MFSDIVNEHTRYIEYPAMSFRVVKEKKGIGNIEVSDVIGAIHLKMLSFFFIKYSPFINTRKIMFLK